MRSTSSPTSSNPTIRPRSRRQLKHSAEHNRRRKASPFQSAMSMLNFYVNRAGRNLPKTRRTTLERAKRKLREAFGRKP